MRTSLALVLRVLAAGGMMRYPLSLLVVAVCAAPVCTACSSTSSAPADETPAPDDASANADAPTSPRADDDASDAPLPGDAGAALDARAGDDADADEGGPPPCMAMLCEDFESGKLDAKTWELDTGYDPANTVKVESGKAAHGAYAAHAHLSNAGGGFAFARTKTPFPALAAGLWGRAYVFSTVDATVGHNALVAMESGNASVLEIGQSQGNVQLTFYPPTGENPVGYHTSIPRGVWTCLEWHMQQASPQIVVFADGTSLATYDVSGGQTVPAFTAIRLGLETHAANSSTNDVYVDDVAIDAKRVGCLP
jgi:hypothetical protein